MTKFPRSRNGHTDDGTPLKSSPTACPNCGSDRYFQTLSTEQCDQCGLHFDYWGDGANQVYKVYMEGAVQTIYEAEAEAEAAYEAHRTTLPISNGAPPWQRLNPDAQSIWRESVQQTRSLVDKP
jgi:hypothetical protein